MGLYTKPYQKGLWPSKKEPSISPGEPKALVLVAKRRNARWEYLQRSTINSLFFCPWRQSIEINILSQPLYQALHNSRNFISCLPWMFHLPTKKRVCKTKTNFTMFNVGQRQQGKEPVNHLGRVCEFWANWFCSASTTSRSLAILIIKRGASLTYFIDFANLFSGNDWPVSINSWRLLTPLSQRETQERSGIILSYNQIFIFTIPPLEEHTSRARPVDLCSQFSDIPRSDFPLSRHVQNPPGLLKTLTRKHGGRM